MNKKIKYYLPIYWPLWLMVYSFRLLLLLPYKWQMALGKQLGLLIKCFAKKSRHIAAVNLKICYPEKSDKEREQLLTKSFKNIGVAVFESGLGFWASDKRLKNMTHYQGDENLRLAHEEKKGVLLLGAHFTTLELAGRLCTKDFDFCVTYRPSKIGFINHLIETSMNKHYKLAIPSHDVRAMVQALKKGYIVWYSGDVNPKRRKSVFAPFFGTAAASSKAPGRFVRMTGCKVLPLSHFRRETNDGYDINISEALENFPSDNDVNNATITNQVIEEAVRKCPEQYLWQYKRFKTRPDRSAPKFYKY